MRIGPRNEGEEVRTDPFKEGTGFTTIRCAPIASSVVT